MENWNTKEGFAASGNFVFPEMNFPSNQLDGEDNFLLDEVRLWPGEGSVGSDWDGGSVAARGSSASGAGGSWAGREAPFPLLWCPVPCPSPAAPSPLRWQCWAVTGSPLPSCSVGAQRGGQDGGAPGGGGHGPGEILGEELSR